MAQFKDWVRTLLRIGRGRSLQCTIEDLNPLRRGWLAYFRHAPGVLVLEDVDQWLRRPLRCLLWRQWKRPLTRRRRLIALGLDPGRAQKSSVNGRGPWWNAGASHTKQALPMSYFTRMGLVSLLATQRRLQRVSPTAVRGTARTVV